MATPFYPFKACNLPTDKSFGKQTWLATPKIDGIRAVCREAICNKYNTPEQLFTVQGKRIANNHIRKTIGEHIALLQGFDGELGGLKPTNKTAFKTAVSLVTTIDRVSHDWRWYIFNYFGDGSLAYCSKPFSERWADAKAMWLQLPDNMQEHVVMMEPEVFDTLAKAKEYASSLVEAGHEGAIFTVPEAQYEFKRNLPSKPWSLKYKPFDLLEAKVIGFEEARYSFGKTIPPEKQGMPKGVLGALVLSAPGFANFSCGTGYSAKERKDIWQNQADWLDKIVRVAYLAPGSADRPRSPSYKGERPMDDLDPEHPLLADAEPVVEPFSLEQAIAHIQTVCQSTLGDGNKHYVPTAKRITNWYNNPSLTLGEQLDGHLKYWLQRSST
jgi:hypothetical protein